MFEQSKAAGARYQVAADNLAAAHAAYMKAQDDALMLSGLRWALARIAGVARRQLAKGL